MKSEKETVLELAVFFSTCEMTTGKIFLNSVVKFTHQNVSHCMQYRIADFVVPFTNKKGLL